MTRLVSMTLYLNDIRTSGRYFDARSRIFGDLLIASTTAAVSRPARPGLQIETQAAAVLPDAASTPAMRGRPEHAPVRR